MAAAAKRLSRSSSVGGGGADYYDNTKPRASSLRRYSASQTRASADLTASAAAADTLLASSTSEVTPKKRASRPGEADSTGSPTRKFQSPLQPLRTGWPTRASVVGVDGADEKNGFSETVSTYPGGVSPRRRGTSPRGSGASARGSVSPVRASLRGAGLSETATTYPGVSPTAEGSPASLLTSPSPRRKRDFKVPQEMKASANPVSVTGKRVAVTPAEDSRGGTSMHCGVIVGDAVEQTSAESLRRAFEDRLQSDAINHDANFMGFHDYNVRAKNGQAMMAIFSPREEDEDQKKCTCKQCDPVTALTMPAAGSANAVAQRGVTSRYEMQLDFDGLMPTVPTMTLAVGQAKYKMRKDVMEKQKGKGLYARNCEPMGKQLDTLRLSLGVGASLDETMPANEDFEVSFCKNLGNRGRTDRIPNRDPVCTGETIPPRPVKDHRSNIYKRHSFLPGGGVNCHHVRPSDVVEEKMSRLGMPPRRGVHPERPPQCLRGAETHGITTESYAVSGEPPARTVLLRRRATPDMHFTEQDRRYRRQKSSPPSVDAVGGVLKHLDTEPTDLSVSPRRPCAVATPRDSSGAQRSLVHETLGAIHSARAERKILEPNFSKTCEANIDIYREVTNMAKVFKEQNHIACSMADLIKQI